MNSWLPGDSVVHIGDISHGNSPFHLILIILFMNFNLFVQTSTYKVQVIHSVLHVTKIEHILTLVEIYYPRVSGSVI